MQVLASASHVPPAWVHAALPPAPAATAPAGRVVGRNIHRGCALDRAVREGRIGRTRLRRQIVRERIDRCLECSEVELTSSASAIPLLANEFGTVTSSASASVEKLALGSGCSRTQS